MLNMKDIGRSGHVTRWHSVRTARAQTLAEHQYLVTMIATEIAEQVFGEGLSVEMRCALMNYTLRHDTPELIIGDIPTPAKVHLAAAFSGGSNPLTELEDSICARYVAAKNAVADTPLVLIAKLADYADAIAFLHVEAVNDHGRTIEDKLHRLFAMKLKEAENKYPALMWMRAADVLDELLHGVDNQIALE